MLYAAGPNYRGHVEGMAARRGARPSYPAIPEPNFRSVHAIIGPEDNIVVPAGLLRRRPARGAAGGGHGKNGPQRISRRSPGLRFRLHHRQRHKPTGVAVQRPHHVPGQKLRHLQAHGPPFIVTGADPTGFHIVVRHNGQVWEDFHSRNQIWDTATWIQEMSRYTTLHPGDVLMLGTQGADGDMFPGDTISVSVDGIGLLRNYIVAEE